MNQDQQTQYMQFQAQQAMAQAMLQAKQLAAQANQVKTQVAQQQLEGASANARAAFSAQEAIKRQQAYVQSQYKAEQTRQDMIAEQYNIVLQNVQQLNKNLVLDQQMYTKVMYAQAGQIKADSAARGVQAGTGTEQDIINMMVDETTKTANNAQRRTLNDISAMNDKALQLQVEKAFGKWNLDTQINFSNMIIKDGAF